MRIHPPPMHAVAHVHKPQRRLNAPPRPAMLVTTQAKRLPALETAIQRAPLLLERRLSALAARPTSAASDELRSRWRTARALPDTTPHMQHPFTHNTWCFHRAAASWAPFAPVTLAPCGARAARLCAATHRPAPRDLNAAGAQLALQQQTCHFKAMHATLVGYYLLRHLPHQKDGQRLC